MRNRRRKRGRPICRSCIRCHGHFAFDTAMEGRHGRIEGKPTEISMEWLSLTQ